MSTTLVKHRSALALFTLCLIFTVSVALLACPHQACAADPTLPVNLALTPSGTLPLPDGTTEGSTVAFDYDASTKTLMLKMRNVGTPGDIPDYNWQAFPFGGLDSNGDPTTDIRKIILDEGIRKVGLIYFITSRPCSLSPSQAPLKRWAPSIMPPLLGAQS